MVAVWIQFRRGISHAAADPVVEHYTPEYDHVILSTERERSPHLLVVRFFRRRLSIMPRHLDNWRFTATRTRAGQIHMRTSCQYYAPHLGRALGQAKADPSDIQQQEIRRTAEYFYLQYYCRANLLVVQSSVRQQHVLMGSNTVMFEGQIRCRLV